MSKKTIIIFSVEGQDSNTEILFYEGLKHWITEFNVNLQVYAIGMARESETRKKEIIKSVRIAVTTGPFSGDEPYIFFIGDGDKEEQFQPMQRAAEYAIEFLEEYYVAPNIAPIVIKDIPYSFEKSFERVDNSVFVAYKTHKNHLLFQNFVEKTSWINGDQLLINNIINDLSGLGSNHLSIFECIRDESVE